jgi:hypothetical protein
LFTVYNYNQISIGNSGEIYYTSGDDIEYLINGLTNGETYYARLQCVTASGVTADTGLVVFVAQYLAPVMYSDIDLSLDKDNGRIQISTNLRQITGHGTDYTFVDTTWVDVISEGGVITFSEGLNRLKSDYELQLWMKSLSEDIEFLVLNTANGTITVSYWDSCFHAIKSSFGLKSHYISPNITISSTDVFTLVIRCIKTKLIYMQQE